jgi:hypothetical protein
MCAAMAVVISKSSQMCAAMTMVMAIVIADPGQWESSVTKIVLTIQSSLM